MQSFLKQTIQPLFLCSLVGLLSGLLWSCQGQYGARQQERIEQLLQARQYHSAAERHSKYQDLYKPQDTLLFLLNQSSLDYYSSMYQGSESQDPKGLANEGTPNNLKSTAFERAEYMLRLNDKQQSSFSIQASNDVSKAYPSNLQESLWHNVFASLYYWNRGSLDGALVEMRHNHQKVDIYQQYAQQSQGRLLSHNDEKLGFRNSALMQYLGMIYYREDQLWDDWRINRKDLKSITSATSYYPSPMPDNYLPSGKPETGNGTINFSIFTGTGVRKYAQTIEIVKVPGGVGIRLEDGGDPDSELGFSDILIPTLSENFSYYRMEIPAMQPQESRIDSIVVQVDDQTQQLYPLEPFSQINIENFRRLRADFLPKQITGFILGMIASEVAQGVVNVVSQDSILGLITGLIGSAVVSGATPTPDLRATNFYPSIGWVGELSVAAGSHTVELSYYSSSNLLNRKLLQIEVPQGQSRIVQDYYAH